jgi:hypothetical protein
MPSGFSAISMLPTWETRAGENKLSLKEIVNPGGLDLISLGSKNYIFSKNTTIQTIFAILIPDLDITGISQKQYYPNASSTFGKACFDAWLFGGVRDLLFPTENQNRSRADCFKGQIHRYIAPQCYATSFAHLVKNDSWANRPGTNIQPWLRPHGMLNPPGKVLYKKEPFCQARDAIEDRIRRRVTGQAKRPVERGPYFEQGGLAKYAEVPKPDNTSRAVVNPAALNERCNKPPPCPLAGPRIIRDLFISLGGPWFAVSADYSNWFYQLTVRNNDIQELLTIQLGTEHFIMGVLPMGWSWSPWISQWITWMLVFLSLSMTRKDELKERGFWKEELDECTAPPPSHVTFEDGSFIVIIYDTILYITPEKRDASLFYSSLKTTSEKYNAHLKYVHQTENDVEFGGGHWVYDTELRVTKVGLTQDAKKEHLAAIQQMVNTSRHGRRGGHLCRLAGLANWYTELFNWERFKYNRVFALGAKASALAAKEDGDPWKILWQDTDGWEAAFDQMLANIPEGMVRIDIRVHAIASAPRTPIYGASDASGNKWCFVIYPDEWGSSPMIVEHDLFPPELQGDNIDIGTKELYAFELMLEKIHLIFASEPERPQILGIDNDGDSYLLMKGHPRPGASRDQKKLLDRCAQLMGTRTTIVVQIPTDFNVADSRTRDKDIEIPRLAMTKVLLSSGYDTALATGARLISRHDNGSSIPAPFQGRLQQKDGTIDQALLQEDGIQTGDPSESAIILTHIHDFLPTKSKEEIAILSNIAGAKKAQLLKEYEYSVRQVENELNENIRILKQDPFWSERDNRKR